MLVPLVALWMSTDTPFRCPSNTRLVLKGFPVRPTIVVAHICLTASTRPASRVKKQHKMRVPYIPSLPPNVVPV